MVHHCCIPNCRTRRTNENNVSLHRFPTDKLMILAWLRAIKRYEQPTKFTRICSLHFDENDFKPAAYSDFRRFLKLGAIPNKNLPIASSSRKQRTFSSKRSVLDSKVISKMQKTTLKKEDGVSSKSENNFSETADTSVLQFQDETPMEISPLCVVPGCYSNSATQYDIQFHPFPQDPVLARLWNFKLRSGKIPAKTSHVCSKHFRPDDYIESNENGGTKVLKKDAIPSQTISNIAIKHLVLLPEPDISDDELTTPLPIKIPKQEVCHVATQTENHMHCDRSMQTDPEPVRTETMNYDELSANDFYFFTGLKLPSFRELTEYLSIDQVSNKYATIITNYDQLILTLIKLRHKFEFIILAKMYGIHRDTVHEIFAFWINILFNRFRNTDLWAIREVGALGYTAIVNCCEIPCDSNNSNVYNILKSETNNRLTIKYLVATDEVGMVIFCSSHLFDGSITDRQAFVQSGLLFKLKRGDKILINSDFDIDDLLKSKKVKLHKPTECPDVHKGEEYINRLAVMTEKFGILKGVFPPILMQYAAKIIFVTNVLLNFVTDTEM